MKPKIHLSFSGLRDYLSSSIVRFDDSRQKTKINYCLRDAIMSCFACMYFHDPSLLQFQKRMENEMHKNNLRTLFKVDEIPTENQIRNIVDEVDNECFRPIYKDYFRRLQRGKHLNGFELFPGLYLCLFDGTQYYFSTRVHCDQCLTTKLRNGEIGYSHKVVQPAISHPSMRQIIPMMLEEISNTDGSTKQDSEQSAAKRLVKKIRKDCPQLGLIVGGDALYPNQPTIEAVLSEDMHYLFRVKLTDHAGLKEETNNASFYELRKNDAKWSTHIYEWINKIKLNKADTSIKVNFFRYRIVHPQKDGKNKVTYIGNWVTDFEITKENILTLVAGGRCRSKIENECFNFLKNHGYHLEHNFGHGDKNLCFNVFILTVLAFYMHQIFELTDKTYKACRKKFGSKLNLWNTLRTLIQFLIFESWELLLDFMLNHDEYNISYARPGG